MKKNWFALDSFPILILFCIIFCSCTPVKNVVYFENLQKDTVLHSVVKNDYEFKIRKNDLLNINIISPEPISTALFNGSQGISMSAADNSGSNSNAKGGYLVDNNGNIVMYKLGVIRVEGLTRNELRLKLEKDLAPYLKDAVVTIRFLNNKVAMLGELSNPHLLTMPNEHLTILDAIAQSGDITITGRRDNVLVIRETPEGKQFKRLNLTDNSIFSSPFYYLMPDDIVYVEPTKNKIKSTSQNQQIWGYVLSGLSIFITLLAYLGR